jgi:phosphate:Na+ symporter
MTPRILAEQTLSPGSPVTIAGGVWQIAGGIGIFLLGMILVTEGVKAFAGESLRKALVRFTGSPWRAFLSGAIATLAVQSSSATTLTVIGFVSAGLLTFSQAVGVVIGASLGTTGTGWLVSVLGLKFSIGHYALPVVAIGALLRLLGRGSWHLIGLPLAGFGLIFVGIDTLQQGMSAAANVMSFADWPSAGVIGVVAWVLVGILMTVITQSSSAAIATVLTALHTGSLRFEQAAALVIGASVGTTVTSLLASLGANVSARRTALAHVIFNGSAGGLALLLFPLLMRGIAWAQQHLGLPPGAISLSLFHSCFIGLAAAIYLPLIGPFSRRIEKLLPESESPLVRHLDASVLTLPEVALEASRRALCDTAAELFDAARRRLIWGNRGYHDSGLQQFNDAIRQIETFLRKVRYSPSESRPLSQTHVGQIHTIDHLLRFEQQLQPPRSQVDKLDDPMVQAAKGQAVALLELASRGLRGEAEPGWPDEVRHRSLELAESRRTDRPRLLQPATLAVWEPDQVLGPLDTIRWLDRLGYHAWRVTHHLSGGEVRADGTNDPLSSDSAGPTVRDAPDEPIPATPPR